MRSSRTGHPGWPPPWGVLVFQDIGPWWSGASSRSLANPRDLGDLAFRRGPYCSSSSVWPSAKMSWGISSGRSPNCQSSTQLRALRVVPLSSAPWPALRPCSLEWAALIAGVAISTFPYNLDIIEANRQHPGLFHHPVLWGPGDGNSQPSANLGMFKAWGRRPSFLIASPVLSVPHPLIFSKTATGLASDLHQPVPTQRVRPGDHRHRPEERAHRPDIQTIIIFVLCDHSVSSTYMIKYNQQLQGCLGQSHATGRLHDLKSAANGRVGGDL